jgi:hypothetical protein
MYLFPKSTPFSIQWAKSLNLKRLTQVVLCWMKPITSTIPVARIQLQIFAMATLSGKTSLVSLKPVKLFL